MNMKYIALLLPLTTLAACSPAETPPVATAPPVETAPAVAPVAQTMTARANLQSSSGSDATGMLELVAEGSGVALSGSVTGLTAGSRHGFHVHAVGDCSAMDASSAGDHFNPAQAPHGSPDAAMRHLGDLPNLETDDQGVANVQITLDNATLGDGGINDLMGKSLVVHEKRDDYATQPSGDSGSRIACGVIR